MFDEERKEKNTDNIYKLYFFDWRKKGEKFDLKKKYIFPSFSYSIQT